jgi:hypothetical protein
VGEAHSEPRCQYTMGRSSVVQQELQGAGCVGVVMGGDSGGQSGSGGGVKVRWGMREEVGEEGVEEGSESV